MTRESELFGSGPTVAAGRGARRRCHGSYIYASCTRPEPRHRWTGDICTSGAVTTYRPRAETHLFAPVRHRCSSRGLLDHPSSRGEQVGLGYRGCADGWPHVDALQSRDGRCPRAGVGDRGGVRFKRGLRFSKSGQGPMTTTHNYTVQRTETAPLYSTSRPVCGCAVPAADGERYADR